MKYAPTCILILTFLLLSCDSKSQNSTEIVTTTLTDGVKAQINMEKVEIKATDGLLVTADIYRNTNPNSKWMILCHQARFSRGEYVETARNFVELGYSCLVLDQRSGDKVNKVVNETASRAASAGKGTGYADALPDIEGALKYVRTTLGAKHVIIIGSSYSASLALIMAAKYPQEIDAIGCFSPGNYFEIDNMKVSEFAAKVSIPCFITSAKNEEHQWKEIFQNIQSPDKVSFLPKSEGFHGSKALWSESEGHEEYWMAFKKFLKTHYSN